MSQQVVSTIIPCFNAELWISEAIDSCLKQTYSNLEIIIIDDGSTDRSLDIIKSYGSKVTYQSGPNQGGNHARNLGFSLSKGEYIQFLDADDYLLPDKVQRQVNQLELTGADAIYSDWQYQYHHSDGGIVLDTPKISGDQKDILASLLSGWWVSPACLLFRRQAVISAGGWDETLTAGQDRDFFTSVVMSGAKVIYQPGCHSVYRRYGNTTVSTASASRYLENHLKILKKTEENLARQDRLDANYKNALAQSYFVLARKYLAVDAPMYPRLLEKVFQLSPDFKAETSDRSGVYRFLQHVIGFRTLESIVTFIKQVRLKNKVKV